MLVSAIFTLVLMPSILKLPPLESMRLRGRRQQPGVDGVTADA